jgi:hypothetical protein
MAGRQVISETACNAEFLYVPVSLSFSHYKHVESFDKLMNIIKTLILVHNCNNRV